MSSLFSGARGGSDVRAGGCAEAQGVACRPPDRPPVLQGRLQTPSSLASLCRVFPEAPQPLPANSQVRMISCCQFPLQTFKGSLVSQENKPLLIPVGDLVKHTQICSW